MNDYEAIPFTQKHENLLLKHSSTAEGIKSDFGVIKGYFSEIKDNFDEIKKCQQRISILDKDMSVKVKKILELVTYGHDDEDRKALLAKEKLKNDANKSSGLVSRIIN